jgi:hypothetical protein
MLKEYNILVRYKGLTSARRHDGLLYAFGVPAEV